MNLVDLVNHIKEDMVPIYHLKDGDEFSEGWVNITGYATYKSDFTTYMKLFEKITQEFINKEVKFLVKRYERN